MKRPDTHEGRSPGPGRSPAALGLALLSLCLLPALATGESLPDPPAIDLAAHERVVFSQFGEDGVIEKIFEVIAPGPKFCVEFGAGDGKANSNMRNLVLNHGWQSFQIEGDPARAKLLEANYADQPRAKTLEAWVWPGNIEILFEENGVPHDLDLLVIDIDSNDYYVWRAIHDFRPKVVMIEANVMWPPPEKMVVDFHPMNYWDGSMYLGASVQSLTDLARKKGYELLYHMTKGPNVFFIAKEYLPLFGIADNSPEAIFNSPPKAAVELWNKRGEGRGAFPPGKRTLPWSAFEIEKKLLHHR